MHFPTLTAVTTLFASAASGLPSENKSDAQLSYWGPGNYFIQNVATGTVLDLLYGNLGPGTPLNGYRLNPGPHQEWQIAATGGSNEVTIINTATGAIASCPHSVNAPNGWYQMIGGEVPVDSYARFNIIFNGDNSIQFKNQANGWCMDLAAANPADGTAILCYPCHPGVNTNQNWNLIAA